MTYKILVTGGCGFIGSHIVDTLIEKGHKVRILDNLDKQVHQDKVPDYMNEKAEFIKGDIRDEDTIKKCIEDIEIVFHEAAAVGVGQSMYKIKEYMDVNTQGTALLLDILSKKEHEVKKLIVASSMSIYGEGEYNCQDCGRVYPNLRKDEQMKDREWEMKCPKCNKEALPIPTSEEKPLMPTSIYAISKEDQEEMSLVVGRAYEIPTIALRYFNVYGPRQSLSNPYTGVAAIFSSNIKNNNPPKIFEDGLQSRDFIHVNDIVQANILVMESKKADYNTYNVGSGKRVTILDVAEGLIKEYGGNIDPLILNKFRSGDIRHCFSDIEKIKKLGFEPKVSFEEGLKILVKWGQNASSVDMTSEATEELLERNLVEK